MSSKRDRRFVIRPDGRDKGEVFKFTTIDMVSGREVCTNEFVRMAERARY